MLIKKYCESVYRHWRPVMTGIAAIVIGLIGQVWGTRAFFAALIAIGVILILAAGFHAWKDCLFDPFIFEIEQLLAFLTRMEFDSVNDSEGVKQSVRFPMSRLPDKIECETERRLVGFMSRLISHKERAERLLPYKCLTPLLGLFTGNMKSNVLIVRTSLEEYKKVLISQRDRWL